MTNYPRTHQSWTNRSRALLFAAALGGTLVFGAGPASAHVSVTPATAEPGAEATELSFSVPNERSDATTTAIELAFPPDQPLALASVRPMFGWKAQVTKHKLASPLTSDDGPVTDAVTKIVWSGGSIGDGEYQDFEVKIGPLPEKATTMVFKVLQTYSDGSVVRWIDLTPASGEEPEHPAPVLQVRAATAASPAAPAAAAPRSKTPAAATTSASTDWTTRAMAGAGLLIALAAAALAVRGRKVTYLEPSPVEVTPEHRPKTQERK
jgi:periplasmic copper chaperone A